MLGNTHELRLAAETELDMNGHSQTVGTLNGSADSLLSLNGGSLTVTNGGTSTGSLTGSGELNIQGGTLDIAGDNSNLTANVNIANSANVLVSHAQGLGKGVHFLQGYLYSPPVPGNKFISEWVMKAGG